MSVASATRLLLRRPDVPLDRLVVAADLRVDRVAQPEALGAQLVDELGLEIAVRAVDAADRLQEAQRDEGVESGGHVDR